MLRGQNPETVFRSLMSQNPDFRQFWEQNKGKTFAQISQEHGIDPSIFGIQR